MIKLIKFFDFWVGGVLAALVPSRKLVDKDKHPALSMLIIRPGGIGDAVFLLPILKALKQKHPLLRVDVLCERRNGEVFQAQEHLLNQVFCYDKPFDLLRVINGRYDVVIDTEQWHYLSALLVYGIRPRRSIGFATRPLRAKLFHQRVAYDARGYELGNFLKLFDDWISPAEAPQDLAGSFNLPLAMQSWAQQQGASMSIVLALGASIPARRLSQGQWLMMASYLLDKGQQVVLLGGRDVAVLADELVKQLNHEGVRNFVGKTSLMESAALIQQGRCFIGLDSGLMHVACALSMPVMAFFGPGQVGKWAPQGRRDAIIHQSLPCSPCTSFGYTAPTCQGRYPCMREIDMKLVFNYLDQLTGA